MRDPSFSRSSRKLTFLRETALYSFTGTLSSPKLIDPLQIALGIVNHETGVRDESHRSHQFPNLALVPRYPGCGGTNLAFVGARGSSPLTRCDTNPPGVGIPIDHGLPDRTARICPPRS